MKRESWNIINGITSHNVALKIMFLPKNTWRSETLRPLRFASQKVSMWSQSLFLGDLDVGASHQKTSHFLHSFLKITKFFF